MLLPKYTIRNIRMISSSLIMKSGYLSSFNDFAIYAPLLSGMSLRIISPLLAVSTAYVLPGIGFSSPLLYASNAILSPTLNLGNMASSRIICQRSIGVSRTMMRDNSRLLQLFWTYSRMSTLGRPATAVGSIGARLSSNNAVPWLMESSVCNISPVPVMSQVVFNSGNAS